MNLKIFITLLTTFFGFAAFTQNTVVKIKVEKDQSPLIEIGGKWKVYDDQNNLDHLCFFNGSNFGQYSFIPNFPTENSFMNGRFETSNDTLNLFMGDIEKEVKISYLLIGKSANSYTFKLAENPSSISYNIYFSRETDSN